MPSSAHGKTFWRHDRRRPRARRTDSRSSAAAGRRRGRRARRRRAGSRGRRRRRWPSRSRGRSEEQLVEGVRRPGQRVQREAEVVDGVADGVEGRRRRRWRRRRWRRRRPWRRTPAAVSAATSSAAPPSSSTRTVPVRCEQGRGRPGVQQPAAVDHHHGVAHPLHVVEQVGGDEDRDAEAGEAGEEGEHLLAARAGRARRWARRGARARGRRRCAWASLVRWRMPVEKPPMGRKRASSRPTRSSTSEARWRAARGGRPASSPKVDDDVGGGLVEREAVVLGHEAEVGRARRRGRRRRACPATSMEPAVGCEQAEGEAQQRGLAGAVGADQPDRAPRHLDGEGVEGRRAPGIGEREAVGAEERGVEPRRVCQTLRGPARRPEVGGEVGDVGVGVEAARVGEHVDGGAADGAGLPAERCALRSPVAARQPVMPKKATAAGPSSAQRWSMRARPWRNSAGGRARRRRPSPASPGR